MKNIITTIPTINKAYPIMDMVSQTVGRYFDYKKETAMIKHETRKVKEQTKIILANIDANLRISLDNNKKQYRLEMYRLDMIRDAIVATNHNKDNSISLIHSYIEMMKDPYIDMEFKAHIPSLISLAHEQLRIDTQHSVESINRLTPDRNDIRLIEEGE